jgi:hypothetical protein
MMPGAVELMVAPNWIWILGFTLLGILAGARHAALRTRPSPGR